MRKCECGCKYGDHFRRTPKKPCRICDCKEYRPRKIKVMGKAEAKKIIGGLQNIVGAE